MKIAVISFTLEGRKTGERLRQILEHQGHSVSAEVKGAAFLDSVSCSVTEWAGKYFEKQDALIFIGAVGIAVRAVAPYIRSKRTDAAVLVIDEKGDYCIPILSGHIGGANELALMIGRELPAVPVITTATDIEGKWAADVFAVKNKLVIRDMEKAKRASAKLLSGGRLLLLSDAYETLNREKYFDSLEVRCSGERKSGTGADVDRRFPDIYVGYDSRKASDETLCLIPRVLTAGIGCKKGTSEEKIRAAVEQTFTEAGIFKEGLKQAASIDLKAEEQGIIDYCKCQGIPFVTYSTEELKKLKGAFSGSEFVEQVTGVDNVCERSALRASGGKLLVKKRVYEGVTIAVAVEEWSVDFE